MELEEVKHKVNKWTLRKKNFPTKKKINNTPNRTKNANTAS